MAGLDPAQHVLVRDLADRLDQAKVKAGLIGDDIGEKNLVTAVLGIVEAELRILAPLVHAIALTEPVARTARDQYANRPDLSVGVYCEQCEAPRDFRSNRCVVCSYLIGTTPVSLTVMDGGLH